MTKMACANELEVFQNRGCLNMSWIAATNPKALMQSYKQYEIDNVNVTKLCGQLMTALKSDNNLSIRDNEMSRVPFRTLSKLTLGTISIYERQVNHLLESTKSLLTRSTFHCKRLSLKRQASYFDSELEPNNKKRRLTNQSDVVNINSEDYLELLRESEAIREWSESLIQLPNSISKVSLENTSQSYATKPISKSIHIREISYHEINWEIDIPELSDDGFGEETFEDRENLLKMFSSFPSKTPPFQNMDSCGNTKKEPTENTNQFIESHNAVDDPNTSIASLSNCHSTILNYENELSTSRSLQFRLDIASSTPIQRQKGNYNERNDKENVAENYTAKSISRRRRSTIIDIKRMLSRDDILNEINEYPVTKCAKRQEIFKLPPKINAKNMFNLQTKKKFFNVKPNKMLKSIKRKTAENYKSIVASIFGTNSTDLANCIYPQWEEEPERPRKRRKTMECLERIEQKTSQHFDYNRNSIAAEIVAEPCIETARISRKLTNDLNEIDYSKLYEIFPDKDENKNANYGHRHMLIKLIDAWKSSQSHLMEFGALFVGANRMQAALGFSVLLDLSSKRFIKIIGTSTIIKRIEIRQTITDLLNVSI